MCKELSSCGSAARGVGFEFAEDLQVELLVECGDLALGRGHEELGSHGYKDAVVSGGVIDEGLAEFTRHQAGVAGGGEQVLKAGEQFLGKRPGVASGDLKKAC